MHHIVSWCPGRRSNWPLLCLVPLSRGHHTRLKSGTSRFVYIWLSFLFPSSSPGFYWWASSSCWCREWGAKEERSPHTMRSSWRLTSSSLLSPPFSPSYTSVSSSSSSFSLSPSSSSSSSTHRSFCPPAVVLAISQSNPLTSPTVSSPTCPQRTFSYIWTSDGKIFQLWNFLGLPPIVLFFSPLKSEFPIAPLEFDGVKSPKRDIKKQQNLFNSGFNIFLNLREIHLSNVLPFFASDS